MELVRSFSYVVEKDTVPGISSGVLLLGVFVTPVGWVLIAGLGWPQGVLQGGVAIA